MVPESRVLLDKPDVSTICPASGKKLRLKDLIPVKFTRIQDDGSKKPVRPVLELLCCAESSSDPSPQLHWLAGW